MDEMEVTHYEVLGITKDLLEGAKEPQQLVKRAYHRALLRHHPDKAGTGPAGDKAAAPATVRQHASSGLFTVDQITTASAVLSDPHRRREYNAALRLSRAQLSRAHQQQQPADFQTGIETLDLDDLEVDEVDSNGDKNGTATPLWYRSCRCGNPRGFEFGQGDLEAVADQGELIVGCRDCSLWLKVHFAVLDEE